MIFKVLGRSLETWNPRFWGVGFMKIKVLGGRKHDFGGPGTCFWGSGDGSGP